MYTHVHCKCVHWLLPDKDETKPDMLRSILAQLDYTYLVNSWTAKVFHLRNTSMLQRLILVPEQSSARGKVKVTC